MQFINLPITLVCFVIARTCSCGIHSPRAIINYSQKTESLLTNDSIKFWDNTNGFGFLINKTDYSITEYAYNEIGQRIKAPYGNDIAKFDIAWKIELDTLTFLIGNQRVFKINVIDKLSADSLIMTNIYPYKGKRVSYFKSTNQKSLPVDGKIIPSDTSKWIIKPKNR